MGHAANKRGQATKAHHGKSSQPGLGHEPKHADPSDRRPTPNDWQPESGTARDNFGPGLADDGTGRRDVEPGEI